MDIRTKLVFAFVALSLGSLLALGVVSYTAVREMLQQAAVRQLEAVAETKRQALASVVAGWKDRVRLVTSRTQLRRSLRAFEERGEPAELARLERIVGDALGAVPALRGIALFDRQGRLVLARGAAAAATAPPRPADLAALARAEGPVLERGVSREGGAAGADHLVVTFLGPLVLDGEPVGSARLVLSADELLAVTRDTTGLGETGETLVVRAVEGGALVLTPLRHDPEAGLERVIAEHPGGPGEPAIAAVQRRAVILRDALDYRGERVWAATRFLDEMRWGIVVKVDADEEMRPVRELRDTMARLSLSLSAFAIVLATLLGFTIARPIRELSDVARRVAEGELDARAPVRGEDEVAVLAGVFNRMTERLVERGDDALEDAAGPGAAPGRDGREDSA